MTRFQKDVTEVEIFLGILFIILPVLFMHPVGISCIGEEWVKWGFWQRLQHPRALQLLNGEFRFHCLNALFAIAAMAITLINKVSTSIKTVLRFLVLLQLALFPFWAILYNNFWSDACVMTMDYRIAFVLYLMISCLHLYTVIASLTVNKNKKSSA